MKIFIPKIIKPFFICCICLVTFQAYSQNVGINTTGATPNASAILDLNTGNSGNVGFLAPQASLQSTTDITTIPSPATGLIVYNTNVTMTLGSGTGYYYYNGAQWNYFLASGLPSGTVTSFSSGNLAPLFTTSVTNVNTTPALAFTMSNAAAYTILGNNTGVSAAPTYFTPILASALFANQGTATTVLHGNAAGNPSWGAVDLTADITGILPVANGGTGIGTIPANGQVLIGNGAGYTLSTLSAGAGISVTNAAGIITIAATGGSGVTSVGLTGPGGIFGITNTNGNPITSTGSFGISTTGTSGGIPYFSSATTIASSALLIHYGIIYGGGAGGAPVSTAALTNGQVLIGSTGAAPVPATLTPAANSGIAITNAAGSITIGTNGVLNNIVTITGATTSYTPTAGTKAIQVELIGGGGGGGGTSAPATNCSAGGGGGAGGYVRFMLANPVGPYTVAVGSGGAGGAGAAGSAGGSTSFNTGITTYTAGGGSGGSKGSANNAAIGGAGGSNAGGATISITGNPGGISVESGSIWGVSGIGGGSILGGGGMPLSLTAAGGPITGNAGAANSGSGGSGGIVTGGGAATGGAGAGGVIIITEYK